MYGTRTTLFGDAYMSLVVVYVGCIARHGLIRKNAENKARKSVAVRSTLLARPTSVSHIGVFGEEAADGVVVLTCA